jgi:hypothetical protein
MPAAEASQERIMGMILRTGKSAGEARQDSPPASQLAAQ